MSKLLIASLVIATVCAEADPGYVYGIPALHNAYPNWPGVSTPYASSTCYGCRGYGKRSADAEPGYLGYGLRPYGYGVPILTAVNGAHHGISQLHPTGHSFQSVVRGKRSADADADAYYRYGYGYP